MSAAGDRTAHAVANEVKATRRRIGPLKLQRPKKQNPAEPRLSGFSLPLLAETEGFEPSIQVLAQMLP